jgi:hypothetical protein
VFITSIQYPGSGFGGLTGADTACAARATAGGLSGTFKAWLSDSQTSAAGRLTHNQAAYVRLDGVKVADDWNDLTDGSLYAPILVDEYGLSRPDGDDASVWTGTQSSGAGDTGSRNCGDWLSSSGTGSFGSMRATEYGGWTDLNMAVTCNDQTILRLYCFEQ